MKGDNVERIAEVKRDLTSIVDAFAKAVNEHTPEDRYSDQERWFIIARANAQIHRRLYGNEIKAGEFLLDMDKDDDE